MPDRLKVVSDWLEHSLLYIYSTIYLSHKGRFKLSFFGFLRPIFLSKVQKSLPNLILTWEIVWEWFQLDLSTFNTHYLAFFTILKHFWPYLGIGMVISQSKIISRGWKSLPNLILAWEIVCDGFQLDLSTFNTRYLAFLRFWSKLTNLS